MRSISDWASDSGEAAFWKAGGFQAPAVETRAVAESSGGHSFRIGGEMRGWAAGRESMC